MARPGISAIVICKNEAANISRCLASLHWVDEVVVVDGQSADNTRELAISFPNVKLHVHDWLGYSATKRLAVSHAVNNWILWVDADEAVRPELAAEIQALTFDEACSAYDMPRRTYFLGTWVQHTGWYPGRVVRLFHKDKADFNDNHLHEGVEQKEGQLGHLAHDLDHWSYPTLYRYFDKMNAYGKEGARELLRKGKPFRLHLLLTSPLAALIKFYFFKAGFKDGAVGLIISVGSAFSHFIKYVNYYYLLKEQAKQ